MDAKEEQAFGCVTRGWSPSRPFARQAFAKVSTSTAAGFTKTLEWQLSPLEGGGLTCLLGPARPVEQVPHNSNKRGGLLGRSTVRRLHSLGSVGGNRDQMFG